ncbi:MAG: hypothetical protein JSS24_14220, partial [Proteobacteria bacterium]|nr:hypothetical protein [Pseudomonadota bacterium]
MSTEHSIRASFFTALLGGVAALLLGAVPAQAETGAQRDPALKALLEKVIGEADCFTDKFEAIVWYKAMEPRLQRFVASHARRIEILDQVYCESKRDVSVHLPPDLVLALI